MVFLERKDIVIVGGYGHVGRLICSKLGEIYPGYVYAAGRSMEKAETFSASTNGKVLPLLLDINKAVPASLLASVKLVIVCLEQENALFATTCLQAGIDYIDISASYRFLAEVEQLHDLAVNSNAAAMLSVGLNPGITNLLASWMAEKVDHTDAVDIFLMLGLGDTHGHAAIDWTIRQAKKDYYKWIKGKQVKLKSFGGMKSAYFGEQLGWRNAYHFDFADQHVLHHTIAVDDVTTYICFDSRFATGALAFLKAIGLIRFLPIRLSTKLLTRISIGKPMFCVKITVTGRKSGKPIVLETELYGKEEAKITALVTVWAACYMCENNSRTGVFHMEEVLDWTALQDELKNYIFWEGPQLLQKEQ